MEEKNDTNQKRKMISNWLLNENTLLVVSKAEDEEYPTVSIRYQKYGEVRHKDLAILTPDVRVEHNEKMIALFKKNVNAFFQSLLFISVFPCGIRGSPKHHKKPYRVSGKNHVF